jgi:hypothetical protein
MVFFLYSDKNYEYQAENCIRTLEERVPTKTKIVYFTVGFDSDLEFRNLHKVRIEKNLSYPAFNFYKPEICLKVMDMFPNEDYVFTDTDVLFSKRLISENLKHTESYPLASFGPHEYLFSWESIDGEYIEYSEAELMKYLNVSDRTQRYVFSCLFSFNEHCRDFIEEWYSICCNKYLLDRRKKFFPFTDETSFNICLWKRGATKNLGYAFLNTHLLSTIKSIEEGITAGNFVGGINDLLGLNWEKVENTENTFFYHGIKDKDEMREASLYLQNI